MYVNETDYNNDVANKKISGELFKNLSLIKFNIQTNKDGNNTISKISDINMKNDSGIDKYEIYTGTVKENNSINSHILKLWLDEDLDETNIGKYIYLKLEVSSYITGQEP